MFCRLSWFSLTYILWVIVPLSNYIVSKLHGLRVLTLLTYCNTCMLNPAVNSGAGKHSNRYSKYRDIELIYILITAASLF